MAVVLVRNYEVGRHRMPILDLHLELFVVAVFQIGGEAPYQLIVVHGRSRGRCRKSSEVNVTTPRANGSPISRPSGASPERSTPRGGSGITEAAPWKSPGGVSCAWLFRLSFSPWP